MSERAADSLLQLMHRLREAGGGGEIALLSDEDLIARFVQTRDQAAFEVLVWRHGAMVLGAARRRLGRTPDADDAFQGAFLTLARKAGSIRRRGALAAWLHQVVCRIGSRILQRRQARHRREQSLNGHDTIDSRPLADGELVQQIDAEVERLPERYRRVVVLCYLQGRTTEDAASALGCPRGTVLSRLSAARKILQRRLERCGIVPAALGAIVAGSDEINAAAVQLGAQAGTGDVAGRVMSLSTGVIQAMMWNKLRMPIALVLLAGVCVAGAGFVMGQKPETKPDPQAKGKVENPVVDGDAAKIESLLRKRKKNLRDAIELISKRPDLQALPHLLEEWLTMHDRLLEVELELSRTPQERLMAYEQVLKMAQDLADAISDRNKGGLAQPYQVNFTKDAALKIEIAMLKEKMAQKGK